MLPVPVVDCAQAVKETESSTARIHPEVSCHALTLLREDRAQETVFIIVVSPCSVSSIRRDSLWICLRTLVNPMRHGKWLASVDRNEKNRDESTLNEVE
jgi:hypothetical protein